MKNNISESVFSIFLFTIFISASSFVYADWNDINIIRDTDISDGAQYVLVFVYGPVQSTTVNITGGQIGTLYSHGNSVINITGGIFSPEYYNYHPENNDGDNGYLLPSLHSIYAEDSSTLNYYGADLESILCSDESTLNVYNGILSLTLEKNSEINITGGEITGIGQTHSLLRPECSSHVSISGGTFSGKVSFIDNCVVDIYGYGFVYDPEGWVAVDPRSHTEITGGQLQGFWADGTPFSIDFENYYFNDSYSHVILHEIPEPCSLSLLALGAFWAGRKRT